MSLRDDLKAYLDGELTEARRAEVEAALQTDPELKREADDLQRIAAGIKDAARSFDPAGLEKTLDRIQPRRFWTRKMQLVIGGAAMALIITVMLMPAMTTAPSLAKNEMSDLSFKSENNREADSFVKRKGLDYDGQLAPGSANSPAGEAPAASAPAESGARSRAQVEVEVGKESKGYAMQKRGPESNSNVKTHVAGDPSVLDEKVTSDGEEGTLRVKRADPQAHFLQEFNRTPSDRLIIRDGNISIEVDSVANRSKEIEKIVTSVKGYIEDSRTLSNESQPVATYTIRIPAAQFDSTLTKLRAMGKTLDEQSTGTDVSLEVSDSEARARTLKSVEAQFNVLLGKAKTIEETLKVRDRISEVRQEIESLESRAVTLRNLSTLSTINISIQEKPKKAAPVKVTRKSWSGAAWEGAVGGLTDFGKGVARLGIYLFVYAPIWGVPVFFMVWAVRRRPAAK